MYHIVYLTTNLVNQKIYVGVHSTYNLEDGYLGSGLSLNRSIKKYGKENFERKILYYCLMNIDAYEIEQQIVNLQFIKNKNTYNIRLGGRGNFKLTHKEETKLKISNSLKNRKPYEMTNETRLKMSSSAKKRCETSNTMLGKKHSEESKQKMSEVRKQRYDNLPEDEKERRNKRLRLLNENKSHSEESKQRMRDVKQNMSEEKKLEISNKLKESWKRRKERLTSI